MWERLENGNFGLRESSPPEMSSEGKRDTTDSRLKGQKGLEAEQEWSLIIEHDHPILTVVASEDSRGEAPPS